MLNQLYFINILEIHVDVDLASFQDVVVHVTDISHPDQIAQRQNVLDTLGRLKIPNTLKENIIEVGNKVDKLPRLIYSRIKISSELCPVVVWKKSRGYIPVNKLKLVLKDDKSITRPITRILLFNKIIKLR